LRIGYREVAPLGFDLDAGHPFDLPDELDRSGWMRIPISAGIAQLCESEAFHRILRFVPQIGETEGL